MYDTAYVLNRAFLALSGFALAMVNFRGSAGFGNAFLQALPGHCGDYDIVDTQVPLILF